MDPHWLVKLDQTLSSYSILATLLLLALVAGGLFQIGLIGWVLDRFGRVTRWAVAHGFRVWERWLSWASWGVYLAVTLTLIVGGGVTATTAPVVTLLCAGALLAMGVATCLAYMFIDVERYEIERGRKAVHNPTKGQELASNVARYGHRVGVPLMGVAAAGVIGGFVLLNQGTYETVGRNWYVIEGDTHPGFVDFFTYAIINLVRLVDVLNLADSKQLVHTAFVRSAAPPTSLLLAAFKSFFTLILLQQVFASVRQGRLMSETIADFWSPHEPIHDRARNALPQFGAAAIGPVLVSLRGLTALTKEQRDQLPLVLAAIGPSTVPMLVRHLSDPHEHVRAVAAAALGHLHARDAVADVAGLLGDPSGMARLSAAEALGSIAEGGVKAERVRRVRRPRRANTRWPFLNRAQETGRELDPTGFAVENLRRALGDELAAVRGAAAAALGRAGAPAGHVAKELAALLTDTDETVRCRAAEALGAVGAAPELLAPALDDPAGPVRAAVARGLKALGRRAAPVVPRLIELLQDREESVREAAAEAVRAVGPLDDGATTQLATGLSSPDTTIRAQAAEALGAVDAPAEHAAPPLIEALADGNDMVRAKAAEALGKLGAEAAEVAVPHLVKALRDRDSWVSALAAEALGEMGVGQGVVPGLIRALGHVNPQVRANAAEALGKLGSSAGMARAALEKAATDEDGAVRARAVRGLGTLGSPTIGTARLVREAFKDTDPVVRTGAAAAAAAWDRPPEDLLADLLPLLRDPNDQVKVQVCETLSKWVQATDPVVDGLCEALTADDSDWVQAAASQALARLGAAAVNAGAALLRAARTGEAGVREQAMRALAMIQPPEGAEAFTSGMSDPEAPVRLVASAGWMRAAEVPESAGSALVEALHDPETQVRANAAHALARLAALPPGAVLPLRECLSDPNDGLRLNAALALRLAEVAEVSDLMLDLLDDPNVRVRMVAAGAVLGSNPANTRAAAVVHAAADDPSPRVRQAVEELLPLIHIEASSTEPTADELHGLIPVL
ncbi:HEAT repeat domain-containing protein [Gemmata sp. JC673]|uniref:HEAT repeat domain-containing protein n=1 Tax=Gemmata algarum TaxID=2975278 RepID=A0ABU5F7E2_9BACT|nr:HEAT repeat domain-containing protein [Gemmata algarum]MDY3563452.1 HEAT repeat domain-containing protein [Gemmata algarum]